MNFIKHILTLIAFGIFSFGYAKDFQESFQKGNNLYENGSYDSAFSVYQKIEENNLISTELFQNLGTCAYKLNDNPNAVYYFEKGLKLSPGNKDLQHNLKLANKRIADKVERQNSYGFSHWISNLVGGTADSWATWAVLCSIIGGCFMVLRYFIPSKFIQNSGITLGLILWSAALVSTLFAFSINNSSQEDQYAIIFSPTLEVRNEPSDISSTAFVLHEGSKVELLDHNETWYKISFGDNKVGWILKETVKVI